MVLNALHGLNYVHRGIVLPATMMLIALMLLLGNVPNVATAETMISGGFTLAVLQIWERYRQRFYLDRTVERGFHWRARLLQFAKWPYQLAAFADVIINREFPYVATPKNAGSRSSPFVLWPHATTLAIMGLAWGIGLAIHGTIPIVVQLSAGAIMIVTAAVLVIEKYPFRRGGTS